MIIDTLDNLKKYVALNPLFQRVVDYLEENRQYLEDHEDAKVELQGPDLVANFSLAKGKTRDEAKLETHNRMIDIQIPFSGAETMGYTPRRALPEMPYDEQKDITFYEGAAEQYITVHPGQFAIFFPQDGHAPCISEEKHIHKVIFKVKA